MTYTIRDCPLCGHWNAAGRPHTTDSPCANLIGRDNQGHDRLCGCTGLRVDAADLAALRRDIEHLAASLAARAAGDIKLAEAVGIVNDSTGQLADRIGGLRDAVAALTDQLADHEARLQRMEHPTP